jgi:hypothetical protein
MTLPRTVADVLSDHVAFEIESIDRLCLNLYQPRLQYGGGVAGFFTGHRGHKFASSALMAPITGAFVANIHHYVAVQGLDLVHFRKGERKDDIARRYLAQATRDDGSVPEGILFVGRAQEKALVFRTQKRRNPVTGGSYAWLVRDTVPVSYFYFYGYDGEFGPFFIKFCSYFPYMARLCCNGNEYAKAQGRHRVHPAGQRLRRRRRRRGGPGHLRLAGRRGDRGAGRQVAGPPAASVHRG